MSELIEVRDGFDLALKEGDRIVRDVLEAFGAVAVTECRLDCPVSDIDTPGYVHLIDAIRYDIEGDTVVVGAYKSYASIVDGGTSKMPARPYFTGGMHRAEARYEETAQAAAGEGPAQRSVLAQGGGIQPGPKPMSNSPVAIRRPANPLASTANPTTRASRAPESGTSPLRAKRKARKAGL